jgi:hypothetical protein
MPIHKYAYTYMHKHVPGFEEAPQFSRLLASCIYIHATYTHTFIKRPWERRCSAHACTLPAFTHMLHTYIHSYTGPWKRLNWSFLLLNTCCIHTYIHTQGLGRDSTTVSCLSCIMNAHMYAYTGPWERCCCSHACTPAAT